MHRRLGTLVLQRLPKKLLPEPDSSQKMSGLLRPKWLPMTELFLGFVVPRKNGSVETTTPPETGVGPEGTLPERWLAVTSMPLAPRSAMPIPEKFLSNCAARHERVLFLTVLPFTSKPPTGSVESFEEHASAVVVDRVSGDGAAVGVGDVDAPRAARDVVADDLGALLARSGPEMKIPVSPERLISLERILVPVRVDDKHADAVVSCEVVARDSGIGARC